MTCAKGAEYAYNLDNEARTESIEYAREMDDRTLAAWKSHPNVRIIDNTGSFEEKLNRGIREIYRVIGETAPMVGKRKFLIEMPDLEEITRSYQAASFSMMQTYLLQPLPNVERRIRQQKSGDDYLYFYTEKHQREDGSKWVTEKSISERKYRSGAR